MRCTFGAYPRGLIFETLEFGQIASRLLLLFHRTVSHPPVTVDMVDEPALPARRILRVECHSLIIRSSRRVGISDPVLHVPLLTSS